MKLQDEDAGSARATVDWQGMLRTSETEEDIAGVTRDYLATWSPEEFAALPSECRPGRFRDGEDVSQWAFTLATTHCAGTLEPQAEKLLAKMVAFATAATTRLAEVKAARSELA